MKFTYRWGQKPLEGFTIKRGLGHGGFGEVYFAVSDGGKEVALKLVRGHSEIEVRGIANCLNLKHPHLVHLYDLRIDSQGNHWLVMEYVLGESLASILSRNPTGLEEPQAREWFLQAARAIEYLHDHAVVHRDIKPANLFVENGLVKLGDYGLSKSLTASQVHQSASVGTIYYMAPEIAGGNYTRQIDVYACGVMLYEMLTGEVPFKGESWNEIAIRHQTDLPDMSKIPPAYVPVLEKALSKKVGSRYSDIRDMIQAVEAIAHMAALANTAHSQAGVQTRATDIRPLVTPPRSASGVRPPSVLPTSIHAPAASLPEPISWRVKLSELATSMSFTPAAALIPTGIWALWNQSIDWGIIGPCFLLTVILSWAVLLPAKLWEDAPKAGQVLRRTVLGGSGAIIGAILFWLDGGIMPKILRLHDTVTLNEQKYLFGLMEMTPQALDVFLGYIFYFGLALGMLRWWLSTERRREERFSFFPLLVSGCWGVMLLGLLSPWYHMPKGYAVLALTGAAVTIQLVSPWRAPLQSVSSYRRRLENPG